MANNGFRKIHSSWLFLVSADRKVLRKALCFLAEMSYQKAHISEISKLDFLVGKWEGDGWIIGRDGQKHPFQQTEKIQYKIDGVAILIEGLGKSNGRISHNALAIISYNIKDSIYRFQSYTSSGRWGSFDGKLIDG